MYSTSVYISFKLVDQNENKISHLSSFEINPLCGVRYTMKYQGEQKRLLISNYWSRVKIIPEGQHVICNCQNHIRRIFFLQ